MIVGRVGAWSIPLRTLPLPDATHLANTMVEAGFETVWVPGGSESTVLPRLGQLLDVNPTLGVASGVLITWRNPAPDVAAWAATLEARALDRLTLGIGVSHPEIAAIAAVKPMDQLRDYVAELSSYPWPVGRPTVVLGSLGPVMSRLAAELCDGVHPYLVPVEHTARVRELVGPNALVAPEQGVVLESDPAVARAIAREHLAPYLTRTNYVRNWLRLGYTEDDVAGGGSDRLVDGLIAWGSGDDIAVRVSEHLAFGADHVCVQLLEPDDGASMHRWSELGAALRSSHS